MTKHSHFPYTSTYSSTPHNTNTTSMTSLTQIYNILQHSKAKKTLYLTTDTTQHILPQTPTQSIQQHKTYMRHIHISIISRHLATRGNNKILHTCPPHISSSEEILLRLTCHSWICGQTPLQWRNCWTDVWKSWLVDLNQDDRTIPPPY